MLHKLGLVGAHSSPTFHRGPPGSIEDEHKSDWCQREVAELVEKFLEEQRRGWMGNPAGLQGGQNGVDSDTEGNDVQSTS